MSTALAVLKILDTTLMILDRQQQVRQNFQQVRDDLARMDAEGRDPTEAEWAALEAKLSAADKILDDRADEARALLRNQDPLGR